MSTYGFIWNISEHNVGTEELSHLEMVGTIVHQLTRNLTEAQIKEAGFDAYFVDHTAGVYPTAASGSPWNAASIGVKGDLISDLTEDMAAEAAPAQKQHYFKSGAEALTSAPLFPPYYFFIDSAVS